MELDNYPLILEVSKDLIGNESPIDNIDNIDIYQISETIYLHPNKVRLLFFKEEHKKITLIKSEASIETKLLPLYKNNLHVIDKNNTFQWNITYLKNITNDDKQCIQENIFRDRQINSIKGFYYCYTLGEIFSTSKQKNNVNNIFLGNELKRKEAIKNKDFKKIITINEEENKELINILNNNHINSYKNININNYKITSFTNNNIKAELYKNIINDVISYNINNSEEFKLEKFEILKTIGDNFKDFSEIDVKEKDEIINYIRGLLKNIKNYETFDIEQITIKEYSILLKSIAHFILKGDDLEKMLHILKENNFSTFKIAFGLWGAIFGFSAIPKTVSNILFENDNENNFLVQEFLKDMYRKIHDIKIEDSINKVYDEQKDLKQEIKKNTDLTINDQKDIPECPKCKASMVVRESKIGKFYGCSNYSDTSCKGNRSYPYIAKTEQSDKSIVGKTIDSMKNLFTSVDKDIKDKVVGYLRQNGHSKINEVKDFISKETGIKYKSNKEFKSFIKDNKLFEFEKLNRSDGIKLKL